MDVYGMLMLFGDADTFRTIRHSAVSSLCRCFCCRAMQQQQQQQQENERQRRAAQLLLDDAA